MNMAVAADGLRGHVDAVSSKSHVHRILICAALSDAPTTVTHVVMSRDIEATIRCLSGHRASFEVSHDTIRVVPLPHNMREETAMLDCGESGSTLRFMLPVAAACGLCADFTGQGRLAQRPLSPLYELMQEKGAALSAQGSFPLSCRGRLSGGDYVIAGNVSSQFISGLLLALPLAEEDSTITITESLQSYDYIRMTLDAVRSFGIEIEQTDKRHYKIPGRQSYRSPGTIRAEGDWSNAAFWLCAGALGSSDITVGNLKQDSLQGDKAVLSILEKLGACVEYPSPGEVRVRAAHLRGTVINAEQIPDLVPVLAVCAAAAQGETRICGAERLRLKESDRLMTVSRMLEALGGTVTELPDGLLIAGTGFDRTAGCHVSSYNDHRIAMAAAVAAPAVGRRIWIEDAGASAKSYPGFFEDFRLLGGEAKEVADGISIWEEH